ncbi:MAG: class B sortase [Bacilli bacterium]|nr:class B sortase [Bacilli bacterium]
MKLKRIVYILIELVFLVLIIISIIMIYKWFNEKRKVNKELEQITNKVIIGKENNKEINFKKLKTINNDTVGWLKINNTNIDYPVVQSKDNSFYLNHSFNKKQNNAGWIFMDYNNKLDGTDKNIIIYGHNRLDNIMFGTLKETLDKDWYSNNDNLKIKFITQDEEVTYKIFSIYKIKEETYYLKTNFNSINYLKFINTLKKRSIHDFDINLNDTKQILTLSTCSGMNNYRLVIHAKKI